MKLFMELHLTTCLNDKKKTRQDGNRTILLNILEISSNVVSPNWAQVSIAGH